MKTRRASFQEWSAGRRMRLEAARRQNDERRADRERLQAQRQEKAWNRDWLMSMCMRRVTLHERPFNVDLRRIWRMDPYVAGQIAGYLNVRDEFAGLLPNMASGPAFAKGLRDSEGVRYADIADDLYDFRKRSEGGFAALARMGLGDLRAAELITALRGHVKTRLNLHKTFVAFAKLLLTDTSGRQDAKKTTTVKP